MLEFCRCLNRFFKYGSGWRAVITSRLWIAVIRRCCVAYVMHQVVTGKTTALIQQNSMQWERRYRGLEPWRTTKPSSKLWNNRCHFSPLFRIHVGRIIFKWNGFNLTLFQRNHSGSCLTLLRHRYQNLCIPMVPPVYNKSILAFEFIIGNFLLTTGLAYH
jgi:hypothetical protein